MACRFTLRIFLLLVAILLPLYGHAQTVNLRIRLSYSDGSDISDAPEGTAGVDAKVRSSGTAAPVRGDFAALQIHVQLQDSFGETMSEKSPDSNGRVDFELGGSTRNVMGNDALTFRIRVYGPNIQEVNLEGVDPYRGDRMLDIALHRKDEPKNVAANSTVALSRLQVPEKAKKECDQGDASLKALELADAEKHFRKALELFPNYDQAHNNLGVVMMQTSRPDEARKQFEQAVASNDKFARAYINLAKLDLISKNYQEGDRELRKALQSEPTNLEALMFGAETALFTGKFEDTIADAKLLHSMPHDGFGLTHFFAGHAYEALHKVPEAIAEYNLFLKESPGSPNVKGARESIARLQSQSAQSH